ncbi:MAG: LexA family protein [Terriglobales bacterium]
MTRRQDILNVIRQFSVEHGCAPTEREIADALGISKTTVHYHIGKLREAGSLRKIEGGGRSLAIAATSVKIGRLPANKEER